ncbi:LLM class flavin-dependent oxidoreductase [Demetria terragena]|uniref:LLM class flavin-dependent oxidoreductase n=1 Tax=Demetria terragena TaxID=63959 RepID=UPI0003648C03|nr:LLM class flavin-dependent oxidoreductase [Demetria terragena]
MRFGITILPEFGWSEAAPLWRGAEEMGFDHAWTYDHLVWAGLPDAPWFGTTPTLIAAAMVTSKIGLGTFVTSPNFRHPVTFMREVLSLDDVSGGRFLCAAGSGGNLDSNLLGGEELSMKQRMDRFVEWSELLDRLLREDHVTASGTYFEARDARTLPGPIRDRVPYLVAANGRRGMRLAARLGDGWVTMGQGSAEEERWASLPALVEQLEVALQAAGRDPDTFPRYLSIDASGYALRSVDFFEDRVGRAAELGFTDVVTHWPRPSDPYAGDRATVERVASEVLPRWR